MCQIDVPFLSDSPFNNLTAIVGRASKPIILLPLPIFASNTNFWVTAFIGQVAKSKFLHADESLKRCSAEAASVVTYLGGAMLSIIVQGVLILRVTLVTFKF